MTKDGWTKERGINTWWNEDLSAAIDLRGSIYYWTLYRLTPYSYTEPQELYEVGTNHTETLASAKLAVETAWLKLAEEDQMADEQIYEAYEESLRWHEATAPR
jgi:hypothetical protein